jgi:hypothetical protein
MRSESTDWLPVTKRLAKLLICDVAFLGAADVEWRSGTHSLSRSH